MKVKLVSLFFSVILMSCSNNNQSDQHKYDYPGLGLILEAYYLDYYDYPGNVNDLISYTNVYNFPENFDTTIKKVKNNKDKIFFKNEKNTLIITLEDSVIYETAHRSPCDELSYNMGFYLGKVLFFDIKELSITSVEITNQFKSGMKEIKIRYGKVKKEGDTNRYIMLNYVYSTGLTPFCNENIQLKDYEYFQEVEEFLNLFSERYHINRIIFTSPFLSSRIRKKDTEVPSLYF